MKLTPEEDDELKNQLSIAEAMAISEPNIEPMSVEAGALDYGWTAQEVDEFNALCTPEYVLEVHRLYRLRFSVLRKLALTSERYNEIVEALGLVVETWI